MKNLILLLTLILTANSSLAVMELDTEFGYSKTRFGEDKSSKSVSRSYSGSLAIYFLSMTAIEFNYSETEDETIINYDLSSLTTGTYIQSQYQNRETSRYGVGIRQALAGKGSFLIPSLSIGWARQKNNSYTNYDLINIATKAVTKITTPADSSEYDSVFGAFGLKLRLTKLLSLKGSVRTYFQAFEWNEAKDQLSYTAGLTWLF